MQISKEKLSEYARLIVRTGANVQPGQVVQLSIAVEQHEFAAMITEEAYLAGAKKVNLNWLSDGPLRDPALGKRKAPPDDGGSACADLH